MFKESDTLPLILAFLTTVLIVTLGFSWLAKNKIGGFGLFAQDSGSLSLKNNPRLENARATNKPTIKPEKAALPINDEPKFVAPVLVPQGTSVTIDGSAKLDRVNYVLRRGFHQQYPGTIITTEGNGGTVGLDLLYARKIDLAALDRPLSQAEKVAGLTEIAIYPNLPKNNDGVHMYYVYREPISPDTEIFLGYVFSDIAQQALKKL